MPVMYQHLTDLIFPLGLGNWSDYSTTTAIVLLETWTNEEHVLSFAPSYVVSNVLNKSVRVTKLIKMTSSNAAQGTLKSTLRWWNWKYRLGIDWPNQERRSLRCERSHAFFSFSLPWKMRYEGICQVVFTSSREGIKDQFNSILCGCEDVQFSWCNTAADFDIVNTDVHNHLLKLITNLFMTIRRCSYASEWMEY